jgi:hypothetical protein
VNQTVEEFTRQRAAIERRLPKTAPFLPGATDDDLERLATATGRHARPPRPGLIANSRERE